MWNRVRASVSFGLLWGVAWALAGSVWGAITWLRFAGIRHPAYGLVQWTARSGVPYFVLGAICGVGFAVLMSRIERGRGVGDLSVRRTALWGALAGALTLSACVVFGLIITGGAVPLLSVATGVVILGGVGALSAGVSVAAAQSARLVPPPIQRQLE